MNERIANQSPFRPFATFSLIWAVTTLVHQLAFTFWTESWQGWILVIGAIAVIFQPNCLLRFVFMVVASLLNLFHKLPFVPNHILWEGMLHIIVLLGIIGNKSGKLFTAESWVAWKPRFLLFIIAVMTKALYFLIPGIPHSYLPGALTTLFLLIATGRLLFKSPPVVQGEAFFNKVAPVLRAAVVIVYFWAAIQKTNWDYLNPDVSCAAILHVKIASYFGGLVPTARWTLYAAVWGSLLFEFAIPILLLIKRTRLVGLIAAVWFHLWLGIYPAAGVYSFTSIILALLFLFYPQSWGENLQQLWNRQLKWLGRGNPVRGRRIAVWTIVAAFFITLIIQGTLYLTRERSFAVFLTANRIGFYTFYVWGCWLGACYLIAAWNSRKKSRELPNRSSKTLAWVGLVLVIANGFLPWLGSRTQTSYSMYSNLRTEGKGNHVFLRRINLFGLQNDMVKVIGSEPNILSPTHRPRGIQQFANPGHTVIPWFELRRLLSEFPDDVRVKYERNGVPGEIIRSGENITGDKTAFEPIPFLARKFLWFRRLDSLDGPMHCTH